MLLCRAGGTAVFGRAHGRDERIGVQTFDQDVEFTDRSMKVLAQS